MGLSTLSRANLVESISFGTVSDLNSTGFVLEFIITLPGGRSQKIYFEDRTVKIFEDTRLIKVFNENRIIKVKK